VLNYIPASALGGWEPLTVDDVRSTFKQATFPWWIVGGHAIDLCIGRETRTHGDIEVAVLRRDQVALQDLLRTFELWYVPEPGKGLVRWDRGTALPPEAHEIWSRETGHELWTLEILVEEAIDDRWIYRRDDRVSAPLSEIGRDIDGVPVIRPEIALLYKSKGSRERDQADFAAVLPHLDRSARTWLADALELTGTGGGWVEALRS
jgi:hypothetical protein